MKNICNSTTASAMGMALLLCIATAKAETNEDGAAAISRGDYAQAEKIFRTLASEGDSVAQFSLGSMHSNGQGVERDYQEAVKWYRLAAAQGHKGAQSSMGYMYYNGQGVQQDYVRAHMWFSLAAANGSGIAKKLRDKISALMSPAQLSESQTMMETCKNRDYRNCD